MALTEKSTRDFFISYNRQDREMAEWIAWQLEEAGYTTVIQSWDFNAGGNFVMEMDQAAKMAERTLAVLSPTYLASGFTRPEWMSAFAEDPTSTQRKLVPVRVAECELTGLLAQIVYIDLVGKDEATARETLLAKIKVTERAKPSAPPVFGMSKNGATAVVRAAEPAAKAKPADAQGACPLWNVPQARNPFFTGREKELAELHRTLTADSKTASTHALTGLGGMGKTQTATEYAYRYRDEYAAVFWARAGSDQELLTDYNQIAKLLELPEADAQNPDEMREAVRKWLATNERWLLILDNVNTPTAVKPFLPTIHSGCVLITTRSQEVRSLGIMAPLSLSQLAPDEAQSFLLRSAGRETGDRAEDAAARKLGVELGGLPLALEQAAAYIAQNDTRFQSYLKSFQRRRLALLDAQAPCTGDYQQSVATTWDINFQAIQQKSRAAIDLLRLSAFLASERIPLELLISSASELGDTLKDALDGAEEDELVLDDLLLPLTRYSLVHRNRETNSYDIHRLVQEVTRMNMDEEMRRTWAERAVRAVSSAFPEAQYENWAACERLLPHALACAEQVASEDFDFDSAIHLLRHLGNYLTDRAQYTQAEVILMRVLVLRERTLGSEHLDVATSCNDLAYHFGCQGRRQEAEGLYQRAYEIWEKTLGPEHSQTAKALNNLAKLYAESERYSEAEKYFRRALDIREKTLGPEHEQTGTTINNLAGLLEDQGMSREAEPLFLRAYNIWNKTLGPEHPQIVLVLTNLAEMYTKQARYAEAGTLFRKALKIAEKAYGPEHPEVAYTLGSLALLYKDQGQFEEAVPLLERAYQIMAQTHGPDHKETLLYRERYATLLRDLGRDSEADALEQNSQAVVLTR